MTEETVRPGMTGDPSLDNDDHDDAQKGAALGGIGGAVTGAVAGSMMGPGGTLAGAVIGGIIGAASGKAAVGAIDKIEHENRDSAIDTPVAGVPEEKIATPVIDPATDPHVVQVPLPDGASTSFATAETPDTETETKTVL